MLTTILTLVILFIISYFLIRKTKKVVTTTTTTVTPNSIHSTPSTQMVYYKLYRCDTAEYYEVGPILEGVYSIGNKVQGATNVYYVISGFQLSTYGYQNILVTNTFLNGCAE